MSTKKKIGVITYWESNDNYGQQLQCWALQHFLRKRGYDAFLIRQYAWPEQWNQKKKGIKRVKQWIKDSIGDILYTTGLAYKPFVYKRFAFCLDKEACRRQFPLFRKEYLKMTEIYDSPENLMANPPDADIYIAGSDQIWNYWLEKGPIRNYFLQFGDPHIKRIAYAPSLGHTSLPDEVKVAFKQYLTRFDAISVRELSAVPVLKELGYDATAVLDPTMLLQAKDYLQLTSYTKGKESVFIYSMNYASADDIPLGEIKAYSERENIPIIVTPGSGYLPVEELFDGVEYSYASISQWILHIANARLIVTASFHGIVFAILFHRPFIYTPLKGEHADSNNRVMDLLENLGLKDRILTNLYSIEKYTNQPINWKEVDDKLNQLRLNSTSYLMNAIEQTEK